MAFGRAAEVTGQTAGLSRRDVLEGIRAGAGLTSRFDVVIATSAFGLGIDYPGIRSVVHACVPETIDRWYQEVGRGGRDGNASVALLAPARGDGEEAASLGLRMLTPELALDRWNFLWDTRRRIGARSFIDLHTPTPGTLPGSYTHRWCNCCGACRTWARSAATRSASGRLLNWGWKWSAGQHDWQGHTF